MDNFKYSPDEIAKIINILNPCENTDDIYHEEIINELNMQANVAIKWYNQSKSSNRKRCVALKNVEEKLYSFKEAINEAADIDAINQDEFDYTFDGVFLNLSHFFESVKNGAQIKHGYRFFEEARDPNRRSFVFVHLTFNFEKYSGKQPSSYKEGSTTKFIIEAWNPIATFLNKNKIHNTSPFTQGSAAKEIELFLKHINQE